MARENRSKMAMDFLRKSDSRVGLIILAALFVPFALLSLFAGMNDAAGLDRFHLFCCHKDRYADLLKAAMSYKSPTTWLMETDVADWPKLFRGFLVERPAYHGLPITHYSMPPLGALFQLCVAQLIMLFNPTSALLLICLLYAGCASFVAFFLRKIFSNSLMDHLAVLSLLLLSYPVLFMAHRGNFLAGFTTLAVSVYVLTALKGHYRWMGLLSLAIAINLRPNTACFGLLELVVAGGLGELILRILGSATLSVIICGLSFMVVHANDPNYSYESFKEAYKVYEIAFIQGSMGLPWNFSLYGATRVVRYFWGGVDPYSPTCYLFVSVMGALSVFASIFLAFTRKLTLVTATFLATCLSALFTPVFAFYHMTEFAIPLLAVMASKGQATTIQPQHKVIFITCLLCLCPIEAEYSLYPIFITGVMLMVMFKAFQQSGITRPETP